MTMLAPKIGQWYIENVTQQYFEIVAIDEKSDLIEVQYSDGDIAEFDMESWRQLPLIAGQAPEDANAGYGLVSELDETQNVQSFLNDGFANYIDEIDTDTFGGYDDIF